MADNRMFLIHRPSNLGILLGKRLGFPWYQSTEDDNPNETEVSKFLEYVDAYDDDFVLALEEPGNELQFKDWKYTTELKDGFRVFKFTGE